MFNANTSHLPFHENAENTRKAVEMARKTGAAVEGELGKIPGSEGRFDVEEDSQTDPDEAAEYVRLTGIDALAVAIGSAHGFYTKAPCLNISRLKEISEKVSIPIVLHGGTGIDDQQIRRSIENGIAKVNICTEFVAAFGRQYVYTQNTPGFKYSVPSLFAPSVLEGKAVVRDKIKLFGG